MLGDGTRSILAAARPIAISVAPTAAPVAAAVTAVLPMLATRRLAFAGRSAPAARRLAAGRAAFRRFEERLAGEADLARGVDVDDFHEDLIAFLHLAPDVLHAVMGHLRN